MAIEFLDQPAGVQYLDEEESSRVVAPKRTGPNFIRGLGETVSALLFGPTEEYKQDFTRGLRVIAGTLPARSAVSAPVAITDTVGDLYLGATEGIYEAVGQEDAAREVNAIRQRSQDASNRLEAWNQAQDEQSAVGEYWAGILRNAYTNVVESATAGQVGGLPMLSNYYAVKATQRSLQKHPDNKWLAATHGLIDGLTTRVLGEMLRPSTAKLAGTPESKASALVSRTIGRVKARVPLDKTVDVLAGVSAETAEELTAELGHYVADVTAGVEKFSIGDLSRRLRDTVAATVVTAGGAEAAAALTANIGGQLDVADIVAEEELSRAERELFEAKQPEPEPGQEPSELAAFTPPAGTMIDRMNRYAVDKTQFDRLQKLQTQDQDVSAVQRSKIEKASEKGPAQQAAELSVVPAESASNAASDESTPPSTNAIAESDALDVKLTTLAALESELVDLRKDLLADSNVGSPRREQLMADIEEMQAKLSESVAALTDEPKQVDPEVVPANPPRTRAQRRIDHLTNRLNRANARVLEAKNQFRKDKQVRNDLVKDAMRYLRESIPPSERSGLMLRASNVKTPAALEKFFAQVDKATAKYETKLAHKQLSASMKRAERYAADPETRAKMDDILRPVDRRSSRTRKQFEALRDYVAQHPESDIPPSLREGIADTEKIPLRDLSAAEVRELATAIDMVAAEAYQANTFRTIFQQEQVDAVAQQVMDEIVANRPAGVGVFGASTSAVANAVFRPEEIMRNLSETLRQLAWENIGVEAQRYFLSLKNDILEDAGSFFGSLGLSPERSLDMVGQGGTALNNWRNAVRSIGGQKLKRSEALHIWLLNHDPQARSRMLEYGVVQDRTIFRRNPADINLTDGTLREISDFIGPEGHEIAQYIFNTVNTTVRDAVNTAWQQVYNRPLSERSDYFPITLDKDWVAEQQDVEAFFSNFQQTTLESYGILQARQGATAPLRIRDAFDVFGRHVDTASRVAAYLAPVRDFHAVYKQKAVRHAVVEASSNTVYEGLMDAVNQQVMPVSDPTLTSKTARRFVRGLGISILGFRLTTPFYNINSQLTASQYIPNGETFLAQSASEVLSPEVMTRVERDAEKLSPYWNERFDRYIVEMTSGMMGQNHFFQPVGIDHAALKHIEVTDKIGSMVRWLMAEKHVEQNRGIRPESPEYGTEVAKEWERLTYRSESTSHGLESNGIIRAGRKHGLVAAFAQFESGASKQRSLLLKARNDVGNGQYKSAADAAAMWATSVAVTAVVAAIASGLKGTNDEELVDRYLGTGLRDAIPVVGGAARQMYRAARGMPAFTDSPSALADALGKLGLASLDFSRAIHSHITGGLNDEGDPAYADNVKAGISNLVPLMGAALQLPLQGGMDSLEVVKNLAGLDGDHADDIAKTLRDLDKPGDLSQPKAKIWKALKTDDDKLFLEAVRQIWETNPDRLSFSTMKAAVDRHFRLLDRLERNPDVMLTESQVIHIREMYADRERLYDALDSMVNRNMPQLEKITDAQ